MLVIRFLCLFNEKKCATMEAERRPQSIRSERHLQYGHYRRQPKRENLAGLIFGSLLFPTKAARDDLQATSVPRECPTTRENSARLPCAPRVSQGWRWFDWCVLDSGYDSYEVEGNLNAGLRITSHPESEAGHFANCTMIHVAQVCRESIENTRLVGDVNWNWTIAS